MVRACPVCGSRRWRRDNVTGSAVCEDGHVYQDFRVEDQEADGPSAYALQRRKMKTGKSGVRKEQGGKNAAYYEGDDAEYLRLQALQLLLRMQVLAIRKLWDLPEVYEMIVKDLWTYQLAISALPPPPEDTASRPDSGPSSVQPQTKSQTSKGTLSKVTTAQGNESDAGEPEGDESDKSDQDNEAGVDLDLLEEMSHLSELSDKEEGYNPRGGRGGKGKTKGRKKRRLKVSDTLVVLSLGLWMMRRGAMCVDIENLVNGNLIPYLDFAHSTLLPAEMRKHMNRNVMTSLSPIRCPPPRYLFASIRILARTLNTDFGIPIPDVNLPLLSWRAIGALGGTPVTLSQVTCLLDLVDMNTSLLETSTTLRTRRARGRGTSRSRASTRGASRNRSSGRMSIDANSDDEPDEQGVDHDEVVEKLAVVYRRTDRNRDVVMPELAVVAAWVVVMKMSYGLDGMDRRALDKDDPVVGLPEGKTWIGELERRMREGSLNSERKDLERRDFSVLSLDDIDRYLNTAEDVLLKDREPPVNSDAQTFPLAPRPHIPIVDPPPLSYRTVHTYLPIITSTPSPLIPGTGIPPEPGEEIRTYDPKDVTGTLPTAYEVVVRAAAEVVGVKMENVAEVVQIIERRLEKGRKERRISMRGKYGKGRAKGKGSRSKSRVGGGQGGEGIEGRGAFEVDEGSEIEEDE